MKVYMVGGSVRDSIMGVPSNDTDWVVVGSSPSEMTSLGYKQVGLDFPVFLHPTTGDEYALARLERKVGVGYSGFETETNGVTLEDDLLRRDLTINAIAKDTKGNLHDPYGGIKDISKKVLRHVSSAFSEDPVRILRVARFAAKYPDFTIAASTMSLMTNMVANGEVDSLVSERVWLEITKGLMTPKPSRMFETLRECGALKVIFPELDRLWGVPQTAAHHPEIDTGIHTMMVIDKTSEMVLPLEARYAALVHDLGKGVTPTDVLPRHLGHEGESKRIGMEVAARFKIPKDFLSLSSLVATEHTNIHRCMDLNAKAVMRLLCRCDAIKHPKRFKLALAACEADAKGRLTFENREYPQRVHLCECLDAALSIDAKAASKEALARGLTGENVGNYIMSLRYQAVKEYMK